MKQDPVFQCCKCYLLLVPGQDCTLCWQDVPAADKMLAAAAAAAADEICDLRPAEGSVRCPEFCLGVSCVCPDIGCMSGQS